LSADHDEPAARDRPRSFSLVVPVFNEEAVLPDFYRRAVTVLDSIVDEWELVFVNDGSSDGSLPILLELHARDARVAVIDLARNFGKEAAMTAGFELAAGDVVGVIDADLQDPPELIPALLARLAEGFDVAYAKRSIRHGETWLKRSTANAFYRVIQRISRVRIPTDTGDFRIMNRRAVAALLCLPERHRFMKGLFAWIGFRQAEVLYERDPRRTGQSKFSYWRLWNFALEGITSFSSAPLTILTYVGLAIALLAFAFAAVIVFRTLMYGNPVAGYPSLITVVLFVGGVQLVAIGLLGEYIARMYDEVKARPLYLKNFVASSTLQRARTGADERPGA
jgi:polyisoprenyl-phosphate glycosyltransferase